jgi:nuclear pore complex protein Nup54
MVPVLSIGFDDILKRMEIQSKQVELHQEKLKETAERLTTVQRQYALGTLVRLEEHKRRHTDLTQRLLRVNQKGKYICILYTYTYTI